MSLLQEVRARSPEIEQILWTFSGSGDSGSYDGIVGSLPSGRVTEVSGPVDSLIDSVMDRDASGWEIDGGSYGSGTLNLRSGRYTVSINLSEESEEDANEDYCLSEEDKAYIANILSEPLSGNVMLTWDFSGSGDSGDYDNMRLMSSPRVPLTGDGLRRIVERIMRNYSYDWYNNEGGSGSGWCNLVTGEVEIDGVCRGERYRHEE